MENSQRLEEYIRMPYKVERLGIMVGMLLGDASIVKKYQKNIVICHSEPQRLYFYWKCEVLSSMGYKQHKIREMHPVVNGKAYNTAYIVDFSGEKIQWFYDRFYGGGKRHISIQLLRHLNPYGLAIWFMDDGNRHDKGGKQVCLNTQAYSYEEQIVLQKWFKNKYNLDCSIQKDKKYFKLYFGMQNKTAERFISLILPFIHPTMMYKVR